MNPPFSIDVRDEAPLTVIAVLSGTAWLLADGQRKRKRNGNGNGTGNADEVELLPGDVVVVRGPEPYRVVDTPGTGPGIVIHPGQACTTVDGADVQFSMSQGVRSWGNSHDGDTVMLIGTYETDAEIGAAVTAALPRIALVPAHQVNRTVLSLLETEMATDAPSQGTIIDRLLDVLLVHAVRAWVDAHPNAATGWVAASADPMVARAVDLMHERPGEEWTIDVLAAHLAVSRATLASRFRSIVGEPPGSYLTNWRMLLASELLVDPGATTARIAAEVGYGSAFALSTAFKRRFGISPSAYRRLKYGARAS